MHPALERQMATWGEFRKLFPVTHDGHELLASRDETNNNRYTGDVLIEGGNLIGWELSDPINGQEHSNVWDQGRESAILDAIAPRRQETYGCFRRLNPDLAELIRRSDPEAAVRRETPRALALDLLDRIPPGTRKEDFLPLVTAVLQYLCGRQGEALDRDEAAASFAIAGEQLRYLEDFRRLTGRDFDAATDRVTRAEVDALPVFPQPPAPPVEYECLECGATYSTPDPIEPGGMGCRRCNGR